jgi:predicted DNA binding CopG/RHH family protein
VADLGANLQVNAWDWPRDGKHSTAEDEAREGAIGYSERSRLLYSILCTRCARKKRSASFRLGPQRRKREKSMSTNSRLKKRFEKPRPMTSISIRMPEDVLENLKEVSTALGFSGYQPLIRFYIGQSLRKDLARIEGDPVAIMADSLRRHGVADSVIEEAVAEATKG